MNKNKNEEKLIDDIKKYRDNMRDEQKQNKENIKYSIEKNIKQQKS